jgi:formamidopyrimidine-DNA glycosylase
MLGKLFRAGISPLRAANRISRARYENLVPAIRETLSDAIAAGGSSIRDYVHSDGGAGCFQIQAGVYDRAGEPACAAAGGQTSSPGRAKHLLLRRLPALKGFCKPLFLC